MTTAQGMKMLLLVHDDLANARGVAAMGARGGWRSVFAQGLDAAIAALDGPEAAELDAVLLDGSTATLAERINFVGHLKALRPQLPILHVLPGTDRETGIRGLRLGSTDYIPGPPGSESLLSALGAFLRTTSSGELRPLSEKLSRPLTLDEMVGATPDFRNMISAAKKAAESRLPVLIEGEKGCGKEVLARAIHAASPRAEGPFLTVHCGSLSAAMVGSTLFGHERNAFPGAFDKQWGKIHAAAEGTLFIDEIETLPAEIQQRLVYTIATGEILTIGGTVGKPLNARIIAAADTPLRTRMAAGQFREDLYFRLAAQTITMPSLRQRTADIPALVHHFLARIEQDAGIPALTIDAAAMELLTSYVWPGNVRQLQGALLRAALASKLGRLHVEDFDDVRAQIAEGPAQLPDDVTVVSQNVGGIALYLDDGNLRSLEDIEADIIKLAIAHYRGRMTEVARRLGIGRSTLYRKLADLGIDNAA